MPLFDTVKRKCAEHGTTIYALEKECGFTVGTICKWNDSIPRADRLMKVANYFGTTSDELMKEDTA